jgi:hypothetical protein
VEYEADVRLGGRDLSQIAPRAPRSQASVGGKGSAEATALTSRANIITLRRARSRLAFTRNLPTFEYPPPNSDRLLGDSHFSLHHHLKPPAAVDGVELFHAASHGDWPRRLIVAVPPAQASDDPACPGKASARVGVFLPVGLALERWDERLDGVDFRLGEDGQCRQLMFAVTLLGKLDVDAGRPSPSQGQAWLRRRQA